MPSVHHQPPQPSSEGNGFVFPKSKDDPKGYTRTGRHRQVQICSKYLDIQTLLEQTI